MFLKKGYRLLVLGVADTNFELPAAAAGARFAQAFLETQAPPWLLRKEPVTISAV
jgi:hypothetical protein